MTQTRYPHELIETQQDLDRAYARLVRPAGPGGSTALRRRVIRLSAQLLAHPYWSSEASAGASLGELRAQAREHAAGGGSP
ncbi:hypothetical protein [Streptomyces zhihengii]|uniref:Uncharacterized protein n=1 Tax=Streptomyces zhihengii TaxID=1818004 RepID=A0ABS2V3Y5_9ACTN|nr:hypothetical protein [Streptomyces zhihengii]MBM9624197.1 hypothetical protein [Streptomyces zhihengii]